MNINTRNRAQLKAFFRKNSIPTEGNFADFIDACINMADDGISKLEGNPLSIEAAGDDTSQKKALNFYNSFSDENPTWTLSLNPRSNPDDHGSAKRGLSITDTGGNSRLFIDQSSGRIGLNTLTPAETLEVNGRIKAEKLTLGSWPANSGQYVFFGTNTLDQTQTQNYALLQESSGSNPGRTYLNSPLDIRFRIGNADRMMISNNGRVGIGTTNPQAKQHIFGTEDVNLSGGEGLLVLGDAAGAHLAMDNNEIMAKSNGTTAATLYLQADGGGTSVGGWLSVREYLSFGATTRQMINLWSTRFGIGVQNSTLYYRSSNHFAWFIGGSHDDTTFYPGSGGRRLMALNHSGDLILSARTNPSSSSSASLCRALVDNGGELHINYASDFSSGLVCGSSIARKPGGGSWAATSDIRLKKNIQTLEGALTRLLRLRGVQFEWKDPKSQGGAEGPQTGFIAQEAEEVFPNWIAADNQGYKMISISGFEALTVEALRELDQQLAALKAELGVLKQQTALRA